MMVLILSTLFIGAVLGTRRKVLVLIPAVGGTFAIILAIGVAHGDNIRAIAVAAMLACCSLQLGYVLGVIGQYGMATPRIDRARKTTIPAKSAR